VYPEPLKVSEALGLVTLFGSTGFSESLEQALKNTAIRTIKKKK
jgi:hypothetical protein